MMTLKDMLTFVESMDDTEKQLLKNYLDAIQPIQNTPDLQLGTMDIDELLQTIDMMHEGLSDEEFEAMLDDMNSEYIDTKDADL